jgi:hypothetical protein
MCSARIRAHRRGMSPGECCNAMICVDWKSGSSAPRCRASCASCHCPSGHTWWCTCVDGVRWMSSDMTRPHSRISVCPKNCTVDDPAWTPLPDPACTSRRNTDRMCNADWDSADARVHVGIGWASTRAIRMYACVTYLFAQHGHRLIRYTSARVCV